MRPTPESVISLASRIVDLKRQLAAAEGQWNALFPESDVPYSAALAIPPVLQRKVNSRGGVLKSSDAGRMVAFINRSPKRDFHPKEIAEGTGILLGTVRSNLSRLLEKGMVERRHPRGFYGAVTKKGIDELGVNPPNLAPSTKPEEVGFQNPLPSGTL